MPPTPLILLSGMGADERVFAAQAAALPSLLAPRWPEPRPRETLAGYARRFARLLDPGRPCFIGGASFGGFVALEMLPHLQVRGCILIGSLRSSDELPPAIKALRRVATMAERLPFEMLQKVGTMILASSRPVLSQHGASLLEQLSQAEAGFLRWASWAVLHWNGPARAPAVPVYQIHGEKDHILPVGLTHPDVIVEGAGHALSMSHPAEVTRFIRAVMKK